MKRDPLSEALRALPREKASEGFTDRVLGRLHESQPRRSRSWARPLLAAAAVATLVAGIFLIRDTAPPAATERSARIEALENERARLERELAEIRSQAAQAGSREIFLGGNDELQVFLDVGWSAVRQADSRDALRGGVRPASYPMNQNAGL